MAVNTECLWWPHREPSPQLCQPRHYYHHTVDSQIGKCCLSQRLRSPWSLSPPLEQKSPALNAGILVCKDLGHHLFVPHAVLEKFWIYQKRSGDYNEMKWNRQDTRTTCSPGKYLCIFAFSQQAWAKALHRQRALGWITESPGRSPRSTAHEPHGHWPLG